MNRSNSFSHEPRGFEPRKPPILRPRSQGRSFRSFSSFRSRLWELIPEQVEAAANWVVLLASFRGGTKRALPFSAVATAFGFGRRVARPGMDQWTRSPVAICLKRHQSAEASGFAKATSSPTRRLAGAHSAGNEGMTRINHPLWFPLRGSPSSFPHSLPIAPARRRSTHFPRQSCRRWPTSLPGAVRLGSGGGGRGSASPNSTSTSLSRFSGSLAELWLLKLREMEYVAVIERTRSSQGAGSQVLLRPQMSRSGNSLLSPQSLSTAAVQAPLP